MPLGLIAVIGGLLVATVLTLIFLPALYAIVSGVRGTPQREEATVSGPSGAPLRA